MQVFDRAMGLVLESQASSRLRSSKEGAAKWQDVVYYSADLPALAATIGAHLQFGQNSFDSFSHVQLQKIAKVSGDLGRPY